MVQKEIAQKYGENILKEAAVVGLHMYTTP
jgi:hypothetical protein